MDLRLSCHLQHWHMVWALVQVPSSPLLIQLPTNSPRKTTEDYSHSWAFTPKWEIWMEWVEFQVAQHRCCGHLGIKQQIETFFLSLLCCLLDKYINLTHTYLCIHVCVCLLIFTYCNSYFYWKQLTSMLIPQRFRSIEHALRLY